MTLYERITTPAGRVQYHPFNPETGTTSDDAITERQVVTLDVSGAVTAMMMLERMLPAHAMNARKMRKAQDAILDLAKGMGETVDPSMAQYWSDAWNLACVMVARGWHQ